MNEMEREYSWDEEITTENKYTLLPEGDYKFSIEEFERKRSKASEKLPECNMAKLTLKVTNGTNSGTVTDCIVLHSMFRWKIGQFFCAIGRARKGESVKMNWENLIGAEGRCRIVTQEYRNSMNETKQCNRIEKYYEAEETDPTVTSSTTATPSTQVNTEDKNRTPSTQVNTEARNWTPGTF